MNREIKFRAWDGNRKRFSYFHLHQFGIDIPIESYYPVTLHRSDDDELYRLEYKDIEFMQFTGLKDKNGKEIYADDILFDGEHKFRVYAMYGGFGIKAPHWSGIMEDMVMGDDLIMQPLADAQTMSYISQSMEVIGNIYEHKHLLQDEK